MKLKTKQTIMLIIALVIILLIGTTKVNAVMTDEDIQKILEIMPNEITLDIPEIEYGKAIGIIENKVKDILKENKIDVSDTDFYVNYYEIYGGLEYFYKATISMQGTHNTQKKEIKIKYNNTDSHNKSDEQAVHNLQLKDPKYATYTPEDYFSSNGIGEAILNNLSQYYQNQISDKTIKVVEASGAYGDPIFIFGFDGMHLAIFKNEALYEIRPNMMSVICKIDIPSNIGNTDSDCINYALPLVKDYWKKVCDMYGMTFDNNITLQKGAVDYYYNGNEPIPTYFDDGYTIKYSNGEILGLVQLKREENFNEKTVEKVDKETGIELETTTDIVPSDIVLEVKPIEKSNITILEDNINNFVAYEITLKSNGVEIQPNGKIKIKIPVPTDFNTEKLVVYRIEENEKVKYDVKVEKIDGIDYAVFETDHFSTYVLAELKQTEIDENNKPHTEDNEKGELDETPKTGIIDKINYIAPLAIISIIGIITLNKKGTK